MSVESITPPLQKKSRWLRRTLIALASLGAVVGAFLWYIGVLGMNLREVSPGQCFRSAQLQGDAFKTVIAEKNLKSVVNLRGERKNSAWYSGELELCKTAGLTHVDIDIGLGELPTPQAIQKLVETLESVPRPVLLHCRAGADRSSLGAVFYVHLVEGKPLEQAEAEQMTWRYGYFGMGDARFINEFFRLYHATSNGQPLKEWVYKTYPAVYAKEAKGQAKGD